MSINTNITQTDTSNNPINAINGSINNSSSSLDLENLTMNYSNLLIQYQQAVLDYNNYLNGLGSSDTSSNTLGYTQSQAYLGGTLLKQHTKHNVDKCVTYCSKTSGCSGATYDSDTNNCYLISGKGNLVAAPSNQYAILPEAEILLSNIENITVQLDFINSKIQNVIASGQQQYNSQNQQSSVDSDNLIQNYEQLLEERIAIAANMKKYNALAEKHTAGSLTVSKNYYSFLLLMFLAIVFILVLVKLSTSPSNSGNYASGYSSPNVEYGGELGTSAYLIVGGLILFIPLCYFLMPIIYSISQINFKQSLSDDSNSINTFFTNLSNKLSSGLMYITG